MGKNKRRQGTWPAPAASDDGAESAEASRRSSRKRDKKRTRNESTLKRKRASKNGAAGSDALALMLHDSFPRRQRAVHDFDHGDGGEEQFADLSDIVATDWQHRVPADDDEDSLYESRKLIMRQLVMNQMNYMRQQQLDDAQLDGDERPSDADSWLEIEASFAEIYEPLPYNVGMDSWRSMSKDEMLKTITSRRLRAEMTYLSRAEILSQIQTMKVRHSKKQRGVVGKSPVYDDVSANRTVLTPPPTAEQPPGAGKQPTKKKEKKVKMVSPEGHKSSKSERFEAHTYQNTNAYHGQSLADIYQAKVEARRRELRRQKEAEQRASALYVTRAQVHAPPAAGEGDDVSNASSGHQGFISRASILSKWGTTSTTPAETTKTKKELIEQFWRKSDYISTENVRSLNGEAAGGAKTPDGIYKNPAAFSSDSDGCSSNCEDCCDDNCSQCSCSSCASVGTVLPARNAVDAGEPQKQSVPHSGAEDQQPAVEVPSEIKAPADAKSEQEEEKAPEPVPLSLVKQRKMEFERLRIIEEQENRLKELVRHQRKTTTVSHSNNSMAAAAAHNQSWLDIAKRARQLEDKWHKARRTASSVVNPAQAMYEPVPASQVLQSNKDDGRTKKSAKSRKSRNRKRSKVLQQLRSRMRENLASESLDPGAKQRRHQELQELLSDALHAGTQTLSNINLGLIYVPMEEQLEQEALEESVKVDDALSGRSSSLRASRLTLVEQLPPEEPPAGQNDEENEDVFGSIDTLIFEPKAGGSSTLRTEEIDEMEKKIAHEFEYLNDSQYGSCHEDGASSPGTSGRSRSSAASSPRTSVSGTSCSTGSKNGRRAVVASVTAMPPQQFRYSTEGQTGSCAAAASCDASAFDAPSAAPSSASSCASLASFDSVVRQGKRLVGHMEKLTVSIPPPPPLPDEPLVPPAESSDELATPRQTDVKSNRSAQLDSEAYTNLDTDASWDYYPEAGSGDGRLLVVGNLRKRPVEPRHFESEADETARLLESLRVAEETNASTSIRLIFPPESSVNSVRDTFSILSERSPSPSNETCGSRSPMIQSPDSGFRSLPAEVPPEPSHQQQSNSPRKRDTMIRELKSRLMDKFQCVGDGCDSSAPPSLRRHPSDGMKTKAKVVSKLESLLATFNGFAEMKAEGRVYRTFVPNESRVEHEPLINDVDYESINFVAPSSAYPHHVANIYQRLLHPDGFSDPASTIYNPSLPDEFVPLYSRLDPAFFDGDQFIDCDGRAAFDEFVAERLEDAPMHEGLYSISDPLDERSSSSEAGNERTRKQRRRRKKRPRRDRSPAWSDAESQIFAEGLTDEEALLLHHQHQLADPAVMHRANQPSRRLAQYHDDWLFWDQMHNWCQSGADRERWDNERARRMLLWMHHVQQNCDAAGLPTPAWWQV